MRCVFISKKTSIPSRCEDRAVDGRTTCLKHRRRENIPALPGQRVYIKGVKMGKSTDGFCGELLEYKELPEPNDKTGVVNPIYAKVKLENHELPVILVPKNKIERKEEK